MNFRKSRVFIFIFLNLVLLHTPAFSQQKWRLHRDLFLGPSRARLLAFCADGRKLNSIGFSFFDRDIMDNMRNKIMQVGGSEWDAEQFLGGLVAAVNIVCPDVR